MQDFTPLSGLVGGLLIGLAVALMLLMNGRAAGISGIVGGLLSPRAGVAAWRAAFVAGLVLGALGYLWAADVSVRVLAPPPAVLVGGSALFGVGWGLIGFCPGPAVAALGTGLLPVFLFVAAMLTGMALYSRFSGNSG